MYVNLYFLCYKSSLIISLKFEYRMCRPIRDNTNESRFRGGNSNSYEKIMDMALVRSFTCWTKDQMKLLSLYGLRLSLGFIWEIFLQFQR